MQIIFPPYVLKRMIERQITVAEVRGVYENGEVIEDYPHDVPPRRLILGWSGKRPLHAIFEDDPVARETIAVTVYEPDRGRWKENFTKRKK